MTQGLDDIAQGTATFLKGVMDTATIAGQQIMQKYEGILMSTGQQINEALANAEKKVLQAYDDFSKARADYKFRNKHTAIIAYVEEPTEKRNEAAVQRGRRDGNGIAPWRVAVKMYGEPTNELVIREYAKLLYDHEKGVYCWCKPKINEVVKTSHLQDDVVRTSSLSELVSAPGLN